MKQKAILLSLLFLPFCFISCQKESNENEADLDKELPINLDEEFEGFISSFNAKSEFHKSRVQFPLKAEILDEDFETIETFIQKGDYSQRFIDLNDSDSYNIKLVKDADQVSVKYSGIENGIKAEYFFKKIKGKWFLVKLIEASS